MVNLDEVAIGVKQALQGVTSAGAHTNLWLRFFQALPPDTLAPCYSVFRSVVPSKSTPTKPYHLKFSHFCNALACDEAHCHLCHNDPLRQCRSPFKNKYLVGDTVGASCEADVCITVVGAADSRLCTWNTFRREFPDAQFQVCALPAQHYGLEVQQNGAMDWTHVAHLGTLTSQTRDDCASTEPVLKRHDGHNVNPDGFVAFEPGTGESCGMCLPPISFRKSGESLAQSSKRSSDRLHKGLPKKTPKLQLVVRAVSATGAPLDQYITPAVSDPFYVATKRVRGALKSDVPSIEEEIKVIKNIGDAAIKKLSDVRLYMPELADVATAINCNSVQRVEDLMRLIEAVQHDRDLEKKLREKLQINETKWAEVVEHVSKAVRPDAWFRVFYAGSFHNDAAEGSPSKLPWTERDLQGPFDIGLVFRCTQGRLQLADDGIVRVVLRSYNSHREKVVPLDIARRKPSFMSKLLETATLGWHRAHSGWGFYKPYDAMIEREVNLLPPEGHVYPLFDNPIPACQHPLDDFALANIIPVHAAEAIAGVKAAEAVPPPATSTAPTTAAAAAVAVNPFHSPRGTSPDLERGGVGNASVDLAGLSALIGVSNVGMSGVLAFCNNLVSDKFLPLHKGRSGFLATPPASGNLPPSTGTLPNGKSDTKLAPARAQGIVPRFDKPSTQTLPPPTTAAVPELPAEMSWAKSWMDTDHHAALAVQTGPSGLSIFCGLSTAAPPGSGPAPAGPAAAAAPPASNGNGIMSPFAVQAAARSDSILSPFAMHTASGPPTTTTTKGQRRPRDDTPPSSHTFGDTEPQRVRMRLLDILSGEGNEAHRSRTDLEDVGLMASRSRLDGRGLFGSGEV